MATTQSAPTDKSNMPPKTRKRVIASVWLILALLSGAVALTLWMFSSSPTVDEEVEAVEEQKEVLTEFNPSQIQHIDELNELSGDVPPISFDPLIRDLRDYPPEFVDSKFIKSNKGKWTVQVMDVSEHEIITDYLNSRKDRKKFAYFRYRDSNNDPRYLLTYETLPDEKSALQVAKSVDFKLPSNVKVLPEKVANYVDVIESYELSPPLKDLSSNRARNVRLQPTQRELAARRRERETKANSESQTTSTKPNTNNSTNQSRPSEPAVAKTEIRNSNDTNNTLSVQEQRTVLVPENNSGSNSGASNANQSAKPKPSNPVEPTKPDSLKKTEPKPAPQGSSSGNDVDKIRQLIEEKSD